MGKVKVNYEEEKQAPSSRLDTADNNSVDNRVKSPASKNSISISKKSLLIGASLVLLVGIFIQLSRIEQSKQDGGVLSSTQVQQSEDDIILERLGSFIELPDEKPTIATLVDVDSLKSNNQFFKNAVNGDKFIVYPQSKKAILYRPSIQKVIEMTVAGFSDSQF